MGVFPNVPPWQAAAPGFRGCAAFSVFYPARARWGVLSPICPLNKKIRTISQSESVRICFFIFLLACPGAEGGERRAGTNGFAADPAVEGRARKGVKRRSAPGKPRLKGCQTVPGKPRPKGYQTVPDKPRSKKRLRLDVNVHLREGNLNAFFAQRGINPLIQRKIDCPIILLFRPDTKHKGK